MSLEQLEAFLGTIRVDKTLYEKVSFAATANEIAAIAAELGFQFTGDELKSISNQSVAGVTIKSQDTTPSYNFGEAGNWMMVMFSQESGIPAAVRSSKVQQQQWARE